MLKNNAGLRPDIAKRVRQWRKKAGLSQAILGKRISVKRSTIANIESARQGILVEQIYSIAEALGVAPANLLPRVNDIHSVDAAEKKLEKEIQRQIPSKSARNILKALRTV